MSGLSSFQLNFLLRAGLAAAAATFGSLGFLGGNVSSAGDSSPAFIHNNALLDTRGFTALGTGSTTVTLDGNGLPTGASTLCVSTPPSAGVAGPLPPGNYYLNVYSVGQTVTATMYATSGMTLGTGVPQGDGVCIRYPVTVALGTAGTQAFNFSGAMSQMPDLARDGSVTAVGQPMFCDTALAFNAQFPSLRAMDFMQTVTRTDTTWSTRPGNFPLRAYGLPNSWEKAIAFFNAVAAYPGSKFKNLLICLPNSADSTYLGNLASLFTSLGLSSSIQLHVDRGDEQWNSAPPFTLYGANLNNAVAELQYPSNYGVTTPLITSIVTDGTTATFTTSNPVSTYISGTTAPCCVVGGAFGFSVGTYASPATATKTGTNTFTVPTTAIWNSTANGGVGGYVGVIFNLTSTLVTDGVLPDVYHAGSKWYVRQLYQDWQTWSAIRPQDRFIMNVQLSGGEGPGGSNSAQIEYPYAAFVNGGSATWLYGSSIGLYITATSNSTVDAVFTQLNTTLNSTTDGQIRAHVYRCKLYGIHPIAYEAGPDLQAVPSLMVSAMSDARMGTLMTNLVNLWTSNGGEIFCAYYTSPGAWSNNAQGGWSMLQSYTDTTSPKYAALIASSASAITYSNVYGAGGAGTYAITAHYQYSTRESVVNGLLGWFETGHVLDIVIPINVTGTYTLTLDCCAQVANPISLYVDPSNSSNGTSLGTSTVPASGSGWNVGSSTDALPVSNPLTVTLTKGIRTIRIVPTTCGGHGTGVTNLVIA